MKSFQSKQKETVWSKANRLPEGWSLESFSNVVEINSNTLSASTPDDYSFYYLSLSDVNSGVINHPAEKICFKSAPERARRIVKQGDILLSTVRPNLQGFGYVDFNGDDYVCSTGFAVLRPKTNVIGQYLYQFLFSHQVTKYFYSCVVGSNYPAINNSDIERITLPLPPIDEQKKISQILSTWDRAIERVQRLIEAKQRQKKGLMQGLLTGKLRFPEFGEPAHKKDEIPNGWGLVRLNQIGSLKAGGTPSTFVPQYWGGEIPWMNSGELNLKFVDSVNGRITESGMKNSNTSMVPRHSVLVGLAGQGKTRGTVAVNEISLCTNQSIAAIIPREEQAHYLFLYYNLDSRYWELRRMSAGDGGRGGLTLSILGNLHIALPKLDEQLQIAQCLFLIDQNIKVLESKKQMLNHQKEGLMQKLLTGKIRVKVN